jgi:dTDP-3-amino-3,4,6-trideoxy-alpha-D-glucose transaminase
MIPFNDLKRLHARHADEIQAAAERVIASGYYILGPEVVAFEAAFAAYHGVGHAVGVANGTDALELALRAADIGAGDEVITVAHTALPTAYAIERSGATPVFADIDPATYTLDPTAFEAAITPRTKAVIPVHIYGQPADMDAILLIAQRHGLLVVEDCAQAHGARLNGWPVGSLGHMAAFSFYPTKNLGAYGDGGAILTDDAELADRLRRLRNYGQQSRYHSDEYGVNSRLDEMQAAILRVKLDHLDEHNAERRELACDYEGDLTGVITPAVRDGCFHVYHLYVVRHPQRDALMTSLDQRGVGTIVHYPVPVHLQALYQERGHQAGELPHTERAAKEIVSLPMYIGLTDAERQAVAQAVTASLEELV